MSDVDFEAFEVDRLKMLIEVTSLINSNCSDFDALLVCILKSAMRLVDCEFSSLFLSQTKAQVDFAKVLSSSGIKTTTIPMELSPMDWVYKNNKSLILDSVCLDHRFFPTVGKTATLLSVPLRVKDSCVGVIQLVNKTNGQKFNHSDCKILELFSVQAGIAYELADKFRIIQEENTRLQISIDCDEKSGSFLAYSPVMLDLITTLNEVAQTDIAVLILGESGVGKELVAQQLHFKSNRAKKPFVKVNCACLSPVLLERELFGQIGEAVTDELGEEIGKFELADGGTIYLDEVGALSLELQSKLLRVLQSKTFEKVGSSKTKTVDVRIIAATSDDLETLVLQGDFRQDLFYRLNILPLTVPPLRNRKEDIEPLALFFCKKFSSEVKKNFLGFSDEAKLALHSYYWPGNVRELENTIERACILGKPPTICLSDLRLHFESYCEGQLDSSWYDFMGSDKTLKTAVNKFKRAYITRILDETSWNQTEASKILGIQRTYVSRLLNELHIR